MSNADNPSAPDFNQLREEANERLHALVCIINDPDAPEWLKTAAELELPTLARLVGMTIPDGTEQ